MPDVKKVSEGAECCLKGLCEICTYKDSDAPGGCKDELILDASNLLEKYDEALKLMVYQYCTMKHLTANDEVFHNKFMSAGEAAFRLLGLENGQSTDGVWERWFPNG